MLRVLRECSCNAEQKSAIALTSTAAAAVTAGAICGPAESIVARREVSAARLGRRSLAMSTV